MKRILSIFFFLAIAGNVFSQTLSVEALRGELKNHPEPDTFRVNRLIELGRVAGSVLSIEKQDEIAYEAVYLSKKLNYPEGEGKALVNLAAVKSQKGEQLKADSLLRIANTVANKIGDKELLINILLEMGNSRRLSSQNKIALTYYLKAEQAAQKLPNKQLLALCQDKISDVYANSLSDYLTALQWSYKSIKTSEEADCQACLVRSWTGIASVYTSVSDQVNSVYYYKKALQANEKLGDKFTQSILLNNIGEAYRLTGKYPEAIKAYLAALTITKKPIDIEINESDLADSYERLGDLPMAFKYAFTSLNDANKLGDDDTKSWIDVVLGRAYLKLNKPDSALYYTKQGFAAAKKTGSIENMRDNSEILNRAYEKKNDFANAYKYLKLYNSYPNTKSNDSIKFISSQTKFNYDLQKKQAQISSLNKEKRLQNYFTISILVVLGLIALTVIVLIKNNTKQRKANHLLNEQKQIIELQRDQTRITLSELKVTQNQLIQSEKMASLGELTAGIAHEIQNPLNFVNNFSEVSVELLDELNEELDMGNTEEVKAIAADIKQNLEKINHHGKRADNIVKGMLQHSRVSGGQKELTDINVLSAEYLRLAYHGLRAKDKEFNAELVTGFDEKLPAVKVVPQDIGRVLLNIYNNAFYAVQQKQKTADVSYRPGINVSTFVKNGHVLISVKDNGSGIPDSIKNKIMQPFFTTKPTGEGTGLGLSLSYDIVVKGHGGSINVESEEGEGSTFNLSLPV